MRFGVRPTQAMTATAVIASLACMVVAMAPASANPATTAAGTITTIAGGVGGPGPSRSVGMSPCAVTYAGHALYVTDFFPDPVFSGTPSVVRRISTASGQLTTLAGSGLVSEGIQGQGESPTAPEVPDGSNARLAAIADSCGVAVDHAGNILVANSSEYADDDEQIAPLGIQVVAGATGRFYGRQMTKGDVYTLVSSQAPGLRDAAPSAIAVDSAGNVLFTSDQNRIYARAVRTGTFFGVRMRAGGIYVIAGGGKQDKNGALATQSRLTFIQDEGFSGIATAGLRLDHHDNLVVADTYDDLVRVIAARNGSFYGQAMKAGHIYTIAGERGVVTSKTPDGGLAAKTAINSPAGLAVDHRGNVLIDAGALVEALAESSGKFYGRTMVRGHLYKIIGSATGTGGNGVPAREAGPVLAAGLSVDGSGNVVIPGAGLQVVPVKSGKFYGEQMQAMHLYTLSDTGAIAAHPVDSGNGGPATQAELFVGLPFGDLSLNFLAADRHADVFMADNTLDSATQVKMIAGSTGTRFGRSVQAGHIYPIAGDGGIGGPPSNGGIATGVGLGEVDGLGADAAGNLLIADSKANQVLVVPATTGTYYGQAMTAGHFYTVAGDGGAGETGDGGPALAARARLS